ncbi:MAG: TetR/AcrR family transcriptional regulator [Lactococcus sp.]|nr:TetR/AcrR family transcriptional regulator [Lactococcus sp.]
MSHSIEFDLKRTEILNFAADLFMTKGYEPTTVNMVLKAVGIAKGTFYYYFDSKEAVMDAVIMRVIDAEIKQAKVIVANKEMAPIEKLISVLFSNPKSEDKKVIIAQLHQPHNALMKQRAMQRTLELLCPIYEQIIIEGNQTGDFSSPAPLSDIQFLIAGMQTLYDLSGLQDSKIEVRLSAVLTTLFCVLGIDEAKITKDKVAARIMQQL